LTGADSPHHHLPIDPDLAASPSIRVRPAVLAAIVAGGFVGSVGRYEVVLAWPSTTAHFPAAIFTINTSGAFALGLLVTLIVARRPRDQYLRPFGCVGVLGGWTTMSTLAGDTDLLVRGHAYVVAATYVLATLLAGLAATTLGIRLARITG
jgi:fluoride exporter